MVCSRTSELELLPFIVYLFCIHIRIVHYYEIDTTMHAGKIFIHLIKVNWEAIWKSLQALFAIKMREFFMISMISSAELECFHGIATTKE